MINDILAVIPARGGSKGVPRKNIKAICGKPLIEYTIDAAKRCEYIQRVIISTDDEEIAEVSKKLGGEVPYLRPLELSGDNSPTVECVIEFLNTLEKNEGYKPDYVALLQCTSPLRNSIHIKEAIEQLLESDMDGIISVCEVELSPYWMNIVNDGKLEYFIEEGKKITRRQDLPQVYRMNGAIYIVKTDILLKYKTFEPDNVCAYIMSQKDSIDIDTKLDFKMAELIMSEGEI